MSSTKSPLPVVGDHAANLAYERLLQGLDVYRGQIPLPFDPSALPRGIHIDPGEPQRCVLHFRITVTRVS